VETRSEFLACLEGSSYDVVLADYSLPAFDGLTALGLLRERDPDLPFVLVSGTMGEEIAVESLKAGVTDYVLNDRLSRLGPAVRRALREREERARRQRAERLLQILNRVALATGRYSRQWQRCSKSQGFPVCSSQPMTRGQCCGPPTCISRPA
jgi:DNA-binding NtrC family response regulator